MTFNSSFAVLLAMLVFGAALVTQAAGRPWGSSWPANNSAIQNTRGGEEGHEERLTIPSFLLNYTSPLDPERTRQYAALWENHTLGQHIEAFCRNANLVCTYPNVTVINDPLTDVSRDDDDELRNAPSFLDNGDDGLAGLQFGERDFVEGDDIVVPERLHESSNRSPAFLPNPLAEKMTLSSEKIQELLDTFHISHNSKLANMMFRTVHHCEVVKEKTSKEIEVTKEKEMKEKEVVLGKEREFEGKEIEPKGKERKAKEIEISKEKEVKVKKSEVVIEEQEKEREFILNKEKEIERTKEQSIMKEFKKKSTEKGKKKEVKKEEKKTKEKQVKKREVEKETKGKESKEKEIEKFSEKDTKEKQFKENVHESTKEIASEERKGKDKEIEYKKKEVKEKEKEIKEKNIHESEEKSFQEKESEDKKVKEKEIEHKKEKELKKKEIHRSEEKSREGKMAKEKETIYSKEKESKEKDFHTTEEKVLEDKEVKKEETKKSKEERKFQEEETEYYKEKELKDKEKEVEKRKEMELKEKVEYEKAKEKEMKEKKIYVRKEEASKEISKCVTSLEGMTSFVKKSLPKEKHIKALERSTSAKRVEKKLQNNKIKWKVLALKKYEKAVVCKSNVFLFAVYKCHDISKMESKFIYHIELEGTPGGVLRKEILACEGKKESRGFKNRKAKKTTSPMKVSCQWVKSDSLVWAPDI